jgi:hypothetical protein
MRFVISRARHRGATLVEFVIVFPLGVLFMLGLIQAGLIYMAKLQLNNATFMAARAGSLNNASEGTIREAVIRGLIPFYQSADDTNDFMRILKANIKAHTGTLLPGRLNVEVLNPSQAAFDDFGIEDPDKGVIYIPNDNLEWRSGKGSSSNLELRDANLLKLKVVYGYELKVPLMAGVLKRMMCGGKIGVEAWGNVDFADAIAPGSTDCLLYYRQDRIPIESFAIVEMQSRAEKPN